MNLNYQLERRNKMLLSELKLMLNQLTDPSNEMTIGETDSLKHISYDEEKDLVILKIAMGRLGGENEKNIKRITDFSNGIHIRCLRKQRRQW